MQMWTRDGNATLDVRDPETDEMKPWAERERRSHEGGGGLGEHSHHVNEEEHITLKQAGGVHERRQTV